MAQPFGDLFCFGEVLVDGSFILHIKYSYIKGIYLSLEKQDISRLGQNYLIQSFFRLLFTDLSSPLLSFLLSAPPSLAFLILSLPQPGSPPSGIFLQLFSKLE